MSERGRRIPFQVSFIGVALIAIEIYLRAIGYAPGNLMPKWENFKPVDSLYIIPDFKVNGEGLLTADSSLWATRNTYINPDGFRSADFAKHDTARKKILLIGDSFVWGMSAQPFQDSCFAALLDTETNYEVANMGIPVADPVQYAAIAKKYIPQLKPDYVLVCFFMGNDLMQEDRQILPDKPFYYYTNAGGIAGYMDGKRFESAQAAYNYLVNERYYLHNPAHFYEKIVAKSSILSRLYSVKFRVQEKMKFRQAIKDSHISKKYLLQIKQIALQNKVPVKFVLIPEVKEANVPVEQYIERYSDLLADSSLQADWLIPQNRGTYYVAYPDGHLNNEGHRYYADYLKAFLINRTELK